MSDPDRDLQGWIEESMPAATPPELDRRVLEAAGAALAARRRARLGVRLVASIATLAAAMLLVVFVRSALDPDPPTDLPDVASARSETVVEHGVVIRVADRGTFEVERGSRIVHVPGSEWLELSQGRATVRAGGEFLKVRFPGGGLLVTNGSASVEVLRTGGPEMKNLMTKLGIGGVATAATAALIAISLESGDGKVETPGGIERRLEPKEQLVFAARPNHVDEMHASIVADGEGEGEIDGGVAAMAVDATKVQSVEQMLHPNLLTYGLRVVKGEVTVSGHVFDRATDLPLPGARIAAVSWIKHDYRPDAHGKDDESEDSPVPLVFPWIVDRSFQEQSVVTSDEGGAFTITNPDDGWFAITADGYGPQVFYLEDSNNDVELRLGEATNLVVQLVDDNDEALRGGNEFTRIEARVDRSRAGAADVSFEIPLASDGTFRIGFTAVDGIEFAIASEGFLPDLTAVLLGVGDQKERIVLESSPYLAGRVLNMEGEPIVGAVLEILETRREGFKLTEDVVGSVRSSAGGYYRVTSKNEQVTLRAEADGYRFLRLEGVPVNDPQYDIRLEAYTPATLAGVVTMSDGSPVVDARVEARRLDGLLDQTVDTASGSDGSFFLEGLRPGPYRLTAKRMKILRPRIDATTTYIVSESITFQILGADGHDLQVASAIVLDPASLTIESDPLEVADADAISGIELVFPMGGSIVGEVRGSDQESISGKELRVLRHDAETGKSRRVAVVKSADDGTFAISGVPEGLYELRAAPRAMSVILREPGGLAGEVFLLQHAVASLEWGMVEVTSEVPSQWVEVREGETVEVIFGTDTAQLRGNFVSDGDGGPRRFQMIHLDEGARAQYNGRVEADGSFEIDEVKEGAYLVRFEVPGEAWAQLARLNAGADPVLQQVPLASGSIRGRVPGQVPSGSEVHVSAIALADAVLDSGIPDAFRRVAIVQVDAGGAFDVPYLAPGRYRVYVRSGGHVFEDVVTVDDRSTVADLR